MNNIDILEELSQEEKKEKKAIEYIKNCLDDEYDYKNATRQKDKKAHNIILNLIEKQSKEIEERTRNKFVSKEESEQRERKAYIKGTNDADELCNKKWEDKIKEKIEEVKDGTYDAKIVLQSLLEKE